MPSCALLCNDDVQIHHDTDCRVQTQKMPGSKLQPLNDFSTARIMLYSGNYQNCVVFVAEFESNCEKKYKLQHNESVQIKSNASAMHPNRLSSYLPHAAFLLHVFLDVVPDATLSEEVATSDLLKLLIAAISLQSKLHDMHCLQEMRNSQCKSFSWLMTVFDNFCCWCFGQSVPVQHLLTPK